MSIRFGSVCSGIEAIFKELTKKTICVGLDKKYKMIEKNRLVV